MQTAGLIFLVSLGFFLLWAILVYFENSKGNRLILNKTRSKLDRAISFVFGHCSVACSYINRNIIKMGWYYFTHIGLKGLLRVVVTVYDWLEQLFHKNRLQVKMLRKDNNLNNKKTMLSEVVEHKATNALTETEKNRLRRKSLE